MSEVLKRHRELNNTKLFIEQNKTRRATSKQNKTLKQGRILDGTKKYGKWRMRESNRRKLLVNEEQNKTETVQRRSKTRKLKQGKGLEAAKTGRERRGQ